MPKSIAVFGAGPALGRAVARRYAREGYTVALVARRREPLEQMAAELTAAGAVAHAISADLSDAGAIGALAAQIRAKVGDLDAMYYGPSGGGFGPAAELTPGDVATFMQLALYTPIALVQEFLPPMLRVGHGAIFAAQGASAVHGLPNFSGPGPALAAQRNYLQSLGAEVADKSVYVGRLYIGATIEGSTWHAMVQAGATAGPLTQDRPTVDPAHLADLLWTMHDTKNSQEVLHPEGIFDR
jgi:short-subunit dehydrogenase